MFKDEFHVMQEQTVSRTEKYYKFVSEPIRDKDVNEIDGINPALGIRLTVHGYDKAYTIVGEFLRLGMDENRFSKWLIEKFQASPMESKNCAQCLTEWCNHFI